MAAYEALTAWAGIDGAWKEGDIVDLAPQRAQRLVEADILEPVGSDPDNVILDDHSDEAPEPAAPKRRKRGRGPMRKAPKEKL